MTLTDEERQALGTVLKELGDFCSQIQKQVDHAINVFGKAYAEEKPKAVDESNFYFEYDNHEGSKLGKFQVADPKDHKGDNRFQRAINILKANKATIGNRYHDQGYKHAYWEFQGRIYRQKLTQ